jgi:hypothetical protein
MISISREIFDLHGSVGELKDVPHGATHELKTDRKKI